MYPQPFKSVNMKSLKHILTLMVALFLVTSCSDDFLNLSPISSRNVEDFYSNEEELNQALTGIYSTLQSTQASYSAQLLSEERSDNSHESQLFYDHRSILHFNTTSDNTQIEPIWINLYEGIYRSNILLEKIEGVEFEDAALKDRMIGEAKFIRALLYFDLVRYFGGVPTTTSTLTIDEAFDKGRDSIEGVYNIIVADLQDAISKLPESYSGADVGRATSHAARALLARVYITRSGYPLGTNEWEQARDLLSQVIQSGQYQFMANYSDIFDISNENGPQTVFAVQFDATALGEGNPVPTRHAPNQINRSVLASGGSPFRPWPTQDLIDSYEEGDVRLEDTISLEPWLDTNGNLVDDSPWVHKFISGTPGSQDTWSVNWMVIRYTDVLMMYAEALNELGYTADGEAFQILNDVRMRAGLAPKTSADVTNQEAFRDWLMEERRHEFAFENLRWHDLVRTDTGVDVMRAFFEKVGRDPSVITRDKYIYPLPARAVQTNPAITQNPGY